MSQSIPAPTSPAPSDLADAVAAATNAPERPELWDEAERLAEEHDRPEDVAHAYIAALAKPLPEDRALELCERAHGFVTQWFEGGAGVVTILGRALEIDPTADWAFRQVTMQLTVDRRFEELLALYDRVIAAAPDDERRVELYGEAAQVAKDLAGNADRAIAYLQALTRLSPDDDPIAVSLERLLEREGRFRELVELWRAHLGALDQRAANARRAQIAVCLLDQLESPGEALDEVLPLLAPGSLGVAPAIELLERVFAFPGAPAGVRVRAREELVRHYSAAGASAEIIRVLGVALSTAEPDAQVELHREIAALLVDEGRADEARGHYAALLALAPEATDARDRLRELCQHAGRLDEYAAALSRAAGAAAARELHAQAITLLYEAASVHEAALHDPSGAKLLYQRIFRAPDVAASTMLEVCRRLDEILAGADERRDRLDVLERRASLEPDPAARRSFLGQAARLAEALGDPDRALASYGLVLAADPADREAHDAVIAVYEQQGRWVDLIAALERAAEAEGQSPRARARLVRAARARAELGAVGPAVETWERIEALFGESAETIDALAELLASAGRFADLAAVLERGLLEAREPERRLALEESLGDVRRTHADDPEGALACYRSVLAEEPARPSARAGARELLAHPAYREEAAQLLLSAFEATGDWAGRLSLLEHRLESARSVEEQTALLLEAAGLEEHRAGDQGAALRALARALPLAPDDTTIQERVLRLAEATDGWGVAAEALASAVAACTSGPRAAELHYQRGGVLEDRLADTAGALEAYLAALSLAQERADVATASVRAASREGRWDVAAATLVASARARGAHAPELVSLIEQTAGDGAAAWDAVTSALTTSVASTPELPSELGSDLLRVVAVWHRDRRRDPASAEDALRQALARSSGDVGTLEMLAGVQRRAPSRALVETLLALAAAGRQVLASLHEAAVVAVDTLHDDALARSILERLLAEVTARLAGGALTERVDLAELSSFAVRELTRLAVASGDYVRAIGILVDAAGLPLGGDAARARLHEAAAIAEDRLGDAERAVELYGRILDSAPADPRALDRLGAIYAAAGRVADLLDLRRRELSLAGTVGEQIDLRLAIAALLGRAGDTPGRLAVLRENLASAPGHPRSLEELAGLLTEAGGHDELAALLEEQAARVEEGGDDLRASDLWTRASELADAQLHDVARALADRTRAASGRPTAETFDALARLSAACGDHVAAVAWLEQRIEALGSTDPAARIATVVRLAEAYVGAGRSDVARVCLERERAEHPGASLLLGPLSALYRASGAWEELVELLTSPGEEPPTLERLREAADICVKKLGSLSRAIPILESMVALSPSSRPARVALASALRGAGEHDRAKAILAGLLEEYGRKRSPERAEVHFQLAQIALASGDAAEAKAQLETTASMSTEHAGALRMLAGMYRAAGDLARAERMYGALHLIALRQKPGAEEDPDRPARSEVMINLHWILAKLGKQARSDEMLASAFEAAGRSEFEASRLLFALREGGDHALLLRALTERLERTGLPAPERAALYSEMAWVLGEPLGRPDEAFQALLSALALDPGSTALRERAVEMARRAGAMARWAEVLEGLAGREEAAGHAALAAVLFSSLAEIHERDLADPARALPLYERAEGLGAEQVSVWRAIDRVSGTVGETSAQIRVLRQLVFAGEAAGDAAAQTEDIYRLAELELGSANDQVAGLSSLEWALGRAPRYPRAGKMLRNAAELGGDIAVLSAYERVARASGDHMMLLDALERAALAGTAGMDLLREAVELAAAAGEGKVDALLARAVEIGEDTTNGMPEVVWALVRLAERREAASDWTGALGHYGRAIDAAEHDEATRLTLRAVTIAEERLQDPKLAADVWERLLARDRHEREVWQPLLALCRRIGDAEVLEAKLREAIECAFDAEWRGELRMERAAMLLVARPDAAAAELDEVLQEDPENAEAAALLTQIYERRGDEVALAELLDRRLSIARSHDDAAAVLELSLRLGGLYARDRPEQAIDVYRAALEASPEDVELLERLLALYRADERPEDRADVMERLLLLEEGHAAAERALALSELRGELDDEEGALRALSLGFRAEPTFLAIRDRLASLYASRERYLELAEMLAFEGASLPGAVGVTRLREAAAVYLDKLDRPADAAAVLGHAAERDPRDVPLLVDLARCLGRAGQRQAGVARVSAALDRGAAKVGERIALLRLRAELTLDTEIDGASADLEAAYLLAPRAVARSLADCLERRRATPAGASDRALLLRLVDLLLDLGEEDRGRKLLGEWIVRSPNDVVVLARAAEIEGYGGRWDSAVELCARLVDVQRGPEKVQAGLLLAGACARGGYPHDARPHLEAVLAETPSDLRIRELLRRIYEETNAHRELATLYLTEARLAADPADRFACLRRAGSLLLESAGDAASAIAPLEAARDLRPRDSEVSMMLADAYIQAGRLQEAADFLDAAIQAQKGRRSREVSMMQQRMAQIARAVGDRGNELAWLNAAFESDSQNGEAAAALADVATEFGQLEVAVKALKAITLMKSPKPISRATAYLRQAIIAQHQGDLRKAGMLAKKAQSEDPHMEEATAFLTQLSGG